MTTAPPKLLEARALLLRHLDIHPGVTVGADLEPAEVGIVGDPSHIGGYHCGKDRLYYRDGVLRDYSVIESDRDKDGLSDNASAMDVGQFTVTSRGRTWTLLDFNAWLVVLCTAGDPDTADIREVIYTVDGANVKRWDRLGKRATGDSTHLWHTHISEFRDARGRRMVTLMTRWLQHIGLIPAQEADMYEQADRNVAWATTNRALAILTNTPTATYAIDGKTRSEANGIHTALSELASAVAALRAEVASLAARPPVDVQALATALAPLVGDGKLQPILAAIAAAAAEALQPDVPDA